MGKLSKSLQILMISLAVCFAINPLFVSAEDNSTSIDLGKNKINEEITPTKCDPPIGNGKTYTNGLLEGVPCNKAIATRGAVVKIIENVLNKILLPVSGVLFVIMFIVGGIAYMTSTGNEERAKKAKKILTAAIIGLLISALAYAIVLTFINLLGGSVT